MRSFVPAAASGARDPTELDAFRLGQREDGLGVGRGLVAVPALAEASAVPRGAVRRRPAEGARTLPPLSRIRCSPGISFDWPVQAKVACSDGRAIKKIFKKTVSLE